MPNNTVVPQIDLGGISDPAVKRALQAIVENFRVRNGEVGNGDNAFLTRAALRELIGYANFNDLTSNGVTPTNETSGRRTTDVADVIRDLQNEIGGSPLSIRLAQAIALITKPATGLLARVGASEAFLAEERNLRVSNDNAILSDVTTRWVQTGQNIAAARTEITLVTNIAGATATRVDTIQARIGNTPETTGSIEQRFNVQATINGRFEGVYTLKIDLGGYISGFGLYAQNDNGQVGSMFLVRADTFAVGAPGLSNLTQIPFIVKTVPFMSNGKLRQPGVYMESAFMGNFVADSGHIGEATVDTLRIRGNAVTIPVTANQNVGVNLANFYQTLVDVSVQFDFAPQQVLVLFSFTQYANGGGTPGDLLCRILRNGIQIYEGALSCNIGFSHAYASTTSDTPGLGTHTYTMQAMMKGIRSDTAYFGQLNVMGALR